MAHQQIIGYSVPQIVFISKNKQIPCQGFNNAY